MARHGRQHTLADDSTRSKRGSKEKVGGRGKKVKREMDRDGERARLARQLERDARLTVS